MLIRGQKRAVMTPQIKERFTTMVMKLASHGLITLIHLPQPLYDVRILILFFLLVYSYSLLAQVFLIKWSLWAAWADSSRTDYHACFIQTPPPTSETLLLALFLKYYLLSKISMTICFPLVTSSWTEPGFYFVILFCGTSAEGKLRETKCKALWER